MEGNTHKIYATATELVVPLEVLPVKVILPPKRNIPSQKLLKGKVTIPKAGKTTRVQWTGKLDEASQRMNRKPREAHQPI